MFQWATDSRTVDCPLPLLSFLQSLPPCGAHCGSPIKLTDLTRSETGFPILEKGKAIITTKGEQLCHTLAFCLPWRPVCILSHFPSYGLITVQKIILSSFSTHQLALHCCAYVYVLDQAQATNPRKHWFPTGGGIL